MLIFGVQLSMNTKLLNLVPLAMLFSQIPKMMHPLPTFWSFTVNQKKEIIETKFNSSRVINNYKLQLLVRNVTLSLFRNATHNLTYWTWGWKEGLILSHSNI